MKTNQSPIIDAANTAAFFGGDKAYCVNEAVRRNLKAWARGSGNAACRRAWRLLVAKPVAERIASHMYGRASYYNANTRTHYVATE